MERSFDRQDLLSEVLTLAYGEEIAGDLKRLGAAMKARAILPGHPYELACSVIHAAIALSGIITEANEAKEPEHSPRVREKVNATIEKWLKPFLVPDWRRAGENKVEWHDKEAAKLREENAAEKRLQAEVIQFRRRIA